MYFHFVGCSFRKDLPTVRTVTDGTADFPGNDFVMLRFGKKWTPIAAGAMTINTSSVMRYFAKDKGSRLGGRNGYITPPLTAPKPKSSPSLGKRVGMVVLLALLLLYLFGFSVPGYSDANKKVVIILAANIGGGNPHIDVLGC